MSVKAPGYYTSWLHVVTEIPAGSNINLYNWIGDYTERNYNHRWTNTSKKLNAILTIGPNTRITSADYTNKRLNDNSITGSSFNPSLLIPDNFRDYDRITIINNGKIVGAYGFRDYDGNGSFTPFPRVESYDIISLHEVTSVNLSVGAGGGDGGNNLGRAAGAGGGGGGSGGRSDGTYSVRPGYQVKGTGSGRLQNASYSQENRVLISATAGSSGQVGQAKEKKRYCGGFKLLGICFNWFDKYDSGEGGKGGAGGRGGQNGQNGQDGQAGKQKYQRDNRQLLGKGGRGGQGAGGRGGNGADEAGEEGNNTSPGPGVAGFLRYSFVQKQLCGPAIVNRHNNVRINNNGQIAGGYSDGVKTIYAVYGAGLAETHPSWGVIYPSSPGYTTTII